MQVVGLYHTSGGLMWHLKTGKFRINELLVLEDPYQGNSHRGSGGEQFIQQVHTPFPLGGAIHDTDVIESLKHFRIFHK